MGTENDHEQCKVLNTEIPVQRPFERITPGRRPGVIICSSRSTAAVAEASTRALLNLLGWQGTILRSSDLPASSGRSARLADLAAALT